MLSGIQKKLIKNFKEYYGVNYDSIELLKNDTVQFNAGLRILIIEYDGRVIYDSKRHIDIR